MKISINQWQLTGSYTGFWEFGHSMELNMKLKGFMPWIPASVPGSVHWDLYQNGIISDPYWHTNSLTCEWVSERDWLFRTELDISGQWQGRKIRLVCEGIDYSAKIRLNGKPIHEHTGMFTPAVVDITSCVNPGQINTLLIGVKKSPDGVGQLGYTNEVDHLKSRFGYKWDFCPRLVHIGLWKPVFLWITGSSWIDDVYVRSHVSTAGAEAHVDVTVESEQGGEAQIVVVLKAPDGSVLDRISRQIYTRPGIQKIAVLFPIDRPQLWWPNGYGEQPLYEANVKLWKTGEGESEEQPSDERSVTFGIRSLEFRQNPEAPSDSLAYTLLVNGRPVYIKGWNWGPVDQLFGRDLREHYGHMIGLAKTAHVNMLRINGVGPIERQLFYDLCDQAGILIWQEMPQSSSGFNNEPSIEAGYLHLLQSTMRDVIREKRNHPSLAIWCGGNELTEGGHLQEQLVPLTDRHPNLRMLRDLAADLDPERLYLPSSPTGPEFFLEKAKGRKGAAHDVHGPWKYQGLREQYELYNQSDALVHSEYGCDGYTAYKNMQKFLPIEEIHSANADSMAWLLHGYEFWNIDAQMLQYFGEVDDMHKKITLGQWLQAEGIRYGVESNRRRAPHCSGSLLWQLNEPYPNVCCTSAVDYYGDPKLAFSWVALANRPVHVSMRYHTVSPTISEEFHGTVFLTTDVPVPDSMMVIWSIRTSDGVVLKEENVHFRCGNELTQPLCDIRWLVPNDIESFFITLCVKNRQDNFRIVSNEYA
ncbi:MAG TPA: glycoside hydrolase family 2 TIM barrel-domain containing protein, partial [Bacilli bacterium]